jgi:hypothetical protein
LSHTPLLLYSASTWLAFSIAERFYGGVHYVWCSPYYDGSTAARHFSVPPSSSPAEIYRTLEDDTRRGDRHSAALEQNRSGVRNGASAKRDAGVINEFQFSEISLIVENAHLHELRPVLYVIPFDRVRSSAVEVPVAECASPFSIEYRIEQLRNDCFDLLELRR